MQNVAWHSAFDHLLSCQSEEETNNAIRCLFVTRQYTVDIYSFYHKKCHVIIVM